MLICKSDTTEPLSILENLPVPCEDNVLDLFSSAAIRRLDEVELVGEDELGVVDTREIARAGGLHLFGLGGEREAVDEVVGDVGVPLVGHDETEVAALAATEAVVTVENELDLVDGVAVVHAGVVEVVVDFILAATAHGPNELDHGVIEVNCDMGLGGRGHGHGEALHGIHELLKAGGGEAITLGTVEVDVKALKVHSDVGVNNGAAGCAVQNASRVSAEQRGRDLDAALERGQLADDLHSVELEGDQGKGIASIVGKPEGKGHVESAGVLGVGHELGHGEALPDHLEEALAGLAGELFPHKEVVVVHGVDDLATDDNADALCHELANGIDPVTVGKFQTGAGIGGSSRGNVVGNATPNVSRVTGTKLDTVTAGVAGIKVGERLGAAVDSLG